MKRRAWPAFYRQLSREHPGDGRSSKCAIQIAHVGNYVDGLVFNICLQLLALAIAKLKSLNIDRPRNLAKSVTVE